MASLSIGTEEIDANATVCCLGNENLYSDLPLNNRTCIETSDLKNCANDSFDYALGILETTFKDETLTELFRILKPGGRLIFSVKNDNGSSKTSLIFSGFVDVNRLSNQYLSRKPNYSQKSVSIKSASIKKKTNYYFYRNKKTSRKCLENR